MFPLALDFAYVLFSFALGAAIAVGKILYDSVTLPRPEQAAYRLTVTDPQGHEVTREVPSLADLERVAQDAVKEMAQSI